MDKEKVYNEEELIKFEKGWCDFMVDIWHDRQMQLRIKDTGNLISSVQGEIQSGATRIITHKFLEYGIYVAAGVGNGYRHGNSGKDDENGLQFLKKDKKGKHRKRRDWFNRKYFYSMKRLNEKEAEFYGEAYQGMLSTALDELFSSDSRLRSL
jgi:hypothetical protein